MCGGDLYKYILFFLFFAPAACFGQNIFNEGEDAYEPDSLYAVRNAIKIDPLQAIFGVYGLEYERILSQGYSIETRMGITRRNYAAGWFDYSLDDLGKNVEIKTGFAFALGVRRYFKPSDELNGSYLSLNASVRKYKTQFLVIDNTGILTGDTFAEERKYTSLALIYGYQALALWSNVFADFYTGISWRYKDFAIAKSEFIHDPSFYRILNISQHTVGFEIGVKLGFGF